MKAYLAIYSHAVDVNGQCMSESLILGHYLDFRSCDIMVGFYKSSHIYVVFKLRKFLSSDLKGTEDTTFFVLCEIILSFMHVNILIIE